MFLPTKSINSLDDGEYPITKIRMVKTRYGDRIVIDIDNEFQTFLPQRIFDHVGDITNDVGKLSTNQLFLHYKGEADSKAAIISLHYHHNAQTAHLEEYGAIFGSDTEE